MADVEQRCPSCGTPRVTGGRFCPGCARDLDAAEPTSYVERYRGTAYDSSATHDAAAPPAAGPNRVLLLLVGLVAVAIVGGAVVVASGMLRTGGQVASASIVPYVPPDPTIDPGGVCATEGVGDAAWPVEWKVTVCDAIDRFYVARKSVQKLVRAAEGGQADVAIATAAVAGQQLDDADRVLGRAASWDDGRGIIEDLETVIAGYRDAIGTLRFAGYTRSSAAITDAERQINAADKVLVRMRSSLGTWTARERPYARYLLFLDHARPALQDGMEIWKNLATIHDMADYAAADRLAGRLGTWARDEERWLDANPAHACFRKVADDYRAYAFSAFDAARLVRAYIEGGFPRDMYYGVLAAQEEMSRLKKVVETDLKTVPACPGASSMPASPAASPSPSTAPDPEAATRRTRSASWAAGASGT